ncbi:MarR family winged helix-turn-helix transcriptional regulator [Streptoalloteichus hindustanus]|uniref:DNA-binding transcriptional regulator, MarR family n=1 Tax=Streptoalloteichus hindustanus TaxID=2017 RepID=A0A1M4WEG7_STRHI|nr:MarR family transcriptional regulator [Streptoalloteichus hindustanus]SHE79604.1 DNA-binding transcriptional regulator, MarR family [Streptoalloteichus hindustanus]
MTEVGLVAGGGSTEGTRTAEAVRRVSELGRSMGSATVMFHTQVAERLGVSPTDHKCLDLVVQARVPITAGRLAELSGLSTGAVTGVVDRLERAGFVRRVRDPQDRRKVLVEPTGTHVRIATGLFDGVRRGVAELVAQYDERQLAAVEGFLETMTEVLRRETARLGELPPATRR